MDRGRAAGELGDLALRETGPALDRARVRRGERLVLAGAVRCLGEPIPELGVRGAVEERGLERRIRARDVAELGAGELGEPEPERPPLVVDI